MKIELGSKVKDKITGYEGIVISRCEWLYGCVRYGVQSQKLKDGKPIESITCDEDQIDVVKAAPVHRLQQIGGGRADMKRGQEIKR